VYIESKFDYGGIGGIIKDVEVCNFFIGIILRAKRWSSINRIYMPIYKTENVKRQIRANKIRKLVSNNSTLSEKRGVEVVYPLLNQTKKATMDAMPKELLELCWYCRYGGDKPCGECITCKQISINK
jgi:7-cyano-7-deazaguanine synthase in queuosine biosynthesis